MNEILEEKNIDPNTATKDAIADALREAQE
jgi:hypothetical protein